MRYIGQLEREGAWSAEQLREKVVAELIATPGAARRSLDEWHRVIREVEDVLFERTDLGPRGRAHALFAAGLLVGAGANLASVSNRIKSLGPETAVIFAGELVARIAASDRSRAVGDATIPPKHNEAARHGLSRPLHADDTLISQQRLEVPLPRDASEQSSTPQESDETGQASDAESKTGEAVRRAADDTQPRSRLVEVGSGLRKTSETGELGAARIDKALSTLETASARTLPPAENDELQKLLASRAEKGAAQCSYLEISDGVRLELSEEEAAQLELSGKTNQLIYGIRHLLDLMKGS